MRYLGVLLAVARLASPKSSSCGQWGCALLAANATESYWPTPFVVVPAVYKEYVGEPPWRDQLPNHASTYMYQRLNASAPRYSPNYGFEAGVHLRFIVDFYDRLPAVVVFTQALPKEHNKKFFQWLKCIDVDRVQFTSLNKQFVTKRGTSFWSRRGKAVVVEQCWRDLLAVFDVTLPPKREPKVSFTCCAQMAVARGMIQRHPRSAYEAALRMLGSDNPCHAGPPDLKAISVSTSKQKPLDKKSLNKHTAGAWEHLNHVILGGHRLVSDQIAPLCDSIYRSPAKCANPQILGRDCTAVQQQHPRSNQAHNNYNGARRGLVTGGW